MSTAAIYDQIKQSGLMFNVRTEKLVTESGQTYDRRVAIVNDETGAPLGIVSPTYKVVTNAEVVDSLLNGLEKSELDTTGAELTIQTSHGGARSMINLVLPAHEIDLNGDKSRLQISTLNSYDGRWKYMSKAGAIRMACLNGQILGKMVGTYASYHTARLDTDIAAERLLRMLEDFHNAKDWWKRLMSQKVTDETAVQTFALYLDGVAKVNNVTEFLERKEPARLNDIWRGYRKELGATAWALYNCLTDYVTHKPRTGKNAAAALVSDQRHLSELIDRSKLFH